MNGFPLRMYNTKIRSMKKLIFLLSALFQFQAQAQLNPAVPTTPATPTRTSKIQIAILFDTSGSMSGLIEQAKSTIWQIVNAASDLRVGGTVPKLEIALYDYGNSGITATNYVRQQISLINDLDSISEKLFALTTNGGDEYCAAVIESAMKDLSWSSNPQDLKIIYIAGNEPFNQGPVDYKKILKDVAAQNIIVNTIYCGPYEKGVQELWYDGSLISQGNYFNINNNKEAVHIDSPYDQTINQYNDSLNSTYIYYGNSGRLRAEKQIAEDQKASGKGMYNVSERAIVKSKSNYLNANWDLVDATKTGNKILDSLRNDELPEELKGKSKEEIERYVNAKKAERERYQQKIRDLDVERQQFIAEEKKKQAESNKEVDLGSAIINSMNTSAAKLGYTVPK